MATATGFWFSFSPLELEEVEGRVRIRSPRMMTSAWMTVFPPRIMLVVPMIWDLRLTLLQCKQLDLESSALLFQIPGLSPFEQHLPSNGWLEAFQSWPSFSLQSKPHPSYQEFHLVTHQISNLLPPKRRQNLRKTLTLTPLWLHELHRHPTCTAPAKHIARTQP